jgi:hypothetical protein
VYIFVLVTEVIIEVKAQILMKTVMSYVMFITGKKTVLMALCHVNGTLSENYYKNINYTCQLFMLIKIF